MSLEIDTSHADQVKVRFVWGAGEPAGPISVVGSFNDWTPGLDELAEDGRGRRSVTLGLPYGQALVFRYLGADGYWFDEPDADEITAKGSVVRPIHRPGAGTR